MVNVPRQKNISRQLCLKLGFAGVFFVFQRPFIQFCAFVGKSVNLSHLRSIMKMGKISRHEGAYAVMRNNFIDLWKTSEIEEGGVTNVIQFVCSEIEPSNWLKLMQYWECAWLKVFNLKSTRISLISFSWDTVLSLVLFITIFFPRVKLWLFYQGSLSYQFFKPILVEG